MEPEFKIQYDSHGGHRIVWQRTRPDQDFGLMVQNGEWVSYHSIAQLRKGDKTYCHATDYWTGTFPVDQVFYIETTGQDYVEWTDGLQSQRVVK